MKTHSTFIRIVTVCILIICLMISPISMLVQNAQAQQRYPGIDIANLSHKLANGRTRLNTGPCVGDIINVHFYPGLLDYLDGSYDYAVGQLDYFIDRPQYTEMNPKQNKYMSIAHFIRGSIFLNHANGIGRYQLAIHDFEASIHWDPHNYQSYLKLAAAYQKITITESAIKTLKSLLSLHPSGIISEEASTMLEKLLSDKNP